MTYRCVALACVLLFAQAGFAKKPAVTTDAFNEMIEANDGEAGKLTDRFGSRSVSSITKADQFKGEVISEKAPEGGRNPFRYNPFIREDDVYVKGVTDDLEAEEPQGASADLGRVGTR